MNKIGYRDGYAAAENYIKSKEANELAAIESTISNDDIYDSYEAGYDAALEELFTAIGDRIDKKINPSLMVYNEKKATGKCCKRC